MSVKRIKTQQELQELAKELGVRKDWHEPDEQEVTARCYGTSFDNAGFWGEDAVAGWHERYGTTDGIEMWVAVFKEDERVAEINLAVLFAFACGTYTG